jgi:hypothetical protein
MSWRFRRNIGFGPFRTTMTKSGLGYSIGIPGLRFGISPSGDKYISMGIPGTGIYWIKYLGKNSTSFKRHIPTQSSPTMPQSTNNKNNTPWWKQKSI